MAKKKKIKNDINPDELHPAIKYGIPLENLSLLAWLNILFVSIAYFFLEGVGLANPSVIILVPSIITVVSFLVSFFDEFIKRYQLFTYILIFLNALITALSMAFVGLAMYLDNGAGAKDFTPDRVKGTLIPVVGLFLVSTICFTIYHQKKVVLKLNKGKALSYPLSFSSIISAVILGRHSNSELSNFIGALCLIIVGAGLFPGGAVGALFCIVNLIKHPELKNNYE